MAQWLDRVKFGSGKNGSPAVSGTINSYATCTGTATQTSLTTALSASLGDVILIHQSQGTGAGQWEINYVLADAGATLTLAYPLAYTYGTGAQAVLVPQYTGGTLSGTVTATAWNGSIGGIIALMSNGALTISGTLSGNAIGFRGGNTSTVNGQSGYYGEGHTGAPAYASNGNANGNGGGAFYWGGWRAGGGGNGSAGGSAGSATGGSTAGSASLVTGVFGGGGGGGYKGSSGNNGNGGTGGGFIFIFSKTIDTSSATINLNGGNGVDLEQDSAAGSGGSCLIKCQVGTLGTNKITSSGGTSPESGAGGSGRIHIDYLTSYTGTTNPSIDATQDTNLTSQVYYGMI